MEENKLVITDQQGWMFSVDVLKGGEFSVRVYEPDRSAHIVLNAEESKQVVEFFKSLVLKEG